MTRHVITKAYDTLRGFSTNSKFVRPSNISDKAINMIRLSDGSFSPRRGYQVQSDDIGGLGNGIYENGNTGVIEPVCISRDGNLYIQKKGTITMSFSDSNSDSYVSYEIYVDPDTVSDDQTCNFDPYLFVDDRALSTDDIKIRFSKSTGYSGASIGTGASTYSGVLPGFPISPGSVLMTDGTLTIQSDGDGKFYGDIGAGTNTINNDTGAYDVSFSGVTGAVTAEYRSTLQVQFTASAGIGYNEATPYTIGDLVSQLAVVTGLTVTTTGNTNKPAAFLEVTEETNVAVGQSITINFYYWQSANRTVASTFSGLVAQLSSDDFRNATFAPYEEAIYIASKYDEVQKYDGQTIYRAGMPRGETVSTNIINIGTGTILAGDYKYYITYEQIDNNGRLVEGQLSVVENVTLASDSNVEVTFDFLLQGSGWNTNCAISDGTNNIVNTIIVDNGNNATHSIRVGDTAFFIDSSGDEQTREVTAITSNSITISGDPVTVSDNTVISNNLKVNIYRTRNGLDQPYLLETYANNSYATDDTFTDTLPDTTIATLRPYDIPVREPAPPPKVGIVKSFGNQIIYTDDPLNEDFVWFSEPKQPEYVPGLNNFIVPSNDDDVTGVGVSGSTLIIFKDKSIYAVSGELAISQFEVNSVAPGSNVGCVSHHTIVSIGGLMYFTDTSGVYSIAEIQLYPTDKFGNPIPLSLNIDKLFREDNVLTNKKFRFKRATAVNYTKDHQYLLFLPAEDSSGVKAANNNSRVFCYDYQTKDWFEWTRVNAAGGWYVLSDNLYWQERQRKNENITAKLFKQHRKYRLIDYVDHVTPIRVTWESSWEDMEQPRVRKKFVRTILLFDEISALFQQNIPTLCFYSYKDWVDGRVSTSADIMQKIVSSKWSTTQRWNYISWSGYQDSFITISLKGGTVSKSLKIGLQLNQINSSFKLMGFQQEISPEFGKTVVR